MSKQTAKPDSKTASPHIANVDLGRVLDQLPIRVYFKDSECRFTYFNQACAEALGLSSPGEGLGCTDADFFTEEYAERARLDEKAILNGEGPLIDEEELQPWRDGRLTWVLTSKWALQDEKGKIVGIVGMSKDVTSAKQELEQYRAAVEGARDGLWYRDLRSNQMWFSARWKAILGYEDHELRNNVQQFEDLVHGADREKVNRARSEHLAGKTETYECEFRMRHKNGKYRWIRARGTATRDKQRKAVAFAGSHTDITQIKEREEFHRHVLDTIESLIFVKNKQLEFTFVNQALADAFQLTKDEIHGKTDADINPNEEQVQHFQADDRKVLQTGRPLEIAEEELTDAAGKKRILATKKVPLRPLTGLPGEPIQVLGVATDISALREAQRDLEHERELLHNLMDNVPDAIFFKDVEGRYSRANGALASLLGVDSPQQLVGKTDCEFFEDESAEESLAIEQMIVATGQPVLNRIRRVKTKKTPAMWRSLTKVPIKNEKGEVIQIVGIVRDISELKDAEEELRAQTELLEQIFDALPQCVWVKDRDSRYRKCNKSFARRRGYAHPEELLGKTDYDHWPKEEADRYVRVDQRVMSSDAAEVQFREEQTMPGGKTAILETSKIPLHNAAGEVVGLLGIYQDITERLEDEKPHLTRLVAESISHCLKNWTTVLEGTYLDLELDLGKTPALARLSEAIGFLKNATDVATRLTALHEKTDFEELSLNEVVKSLAEGLHDPRIRFDPNPENPVVLGSRGHIPNALLELLANARDFAPPTSQGGRIDVWLEARGGSCAIHVRDNGCGVSEHLDKKSIFELFITSDASRTGMGLAYVRQVAEAHLGAVREIGRPGEGAHFVFDLPMKEIAK